MPIRKTQPARGRSSGRNARESSSDQHRGPPGRASLLAALAIAAVGVAGAASYAFIRYPRLLVNRAAEASGGGTPPVTAPPAASPTDAQAAARPVSVAPDKAEILTPLAIIRVDGKADARPVVVLGRPEVSGDMKDRQGLRQGILVRELIR